MEKQVCKKAPAFLSVQDPLCREAVLGAREDEAGSYTQPGGARSGGPAAGTLRGSRPAGVPSGTQCAPASRFPAAMNLHGPAHEAPVYTWAHAAQNSRISVGKQCSNEMLGYGEKRLCAAHAFFPEYETRWERGLHRYEGGEAPLPRLPQHEAEESGRRADSCFINV